VLAETAVSKLKLEFFEAPLSMATLTERESAIHELGIQAAADVFRPVYDATAGAEGFVSIEVTPTIARDTQRTIAAAQDRHGRCDRPNVMGKIPATRERLPAIRHMIGEGNQFGGHAVRPTEPGGARQAER
jgi:transaldolase